MANYKYDYDTLFSIRRLWIIFGASMVVMFGALLYFGVQIYQRRRRSRARCAAAAARCSTPRARSSAARTSGSRSGGMQQGSIWGHGGYVAPDWRADWLHREALALLDAIARAATARSRYAGSRPGAGARSRDAQQAMRTNTYDPQSGVVTVTRRARSRDRGGRRALFATLFQGSTPRTQALREQYAFPINADADADEAPR